MEERRKMERWSRERRENSDTQTNTNIQTHKERDIGTRR
jgi:hypothetical protein